MNFLKALSHFNTKSGVCSKFRLSTAAKVKEDNDTGKIKSWQIHSYGGLEELQLTNSRTPIIRHPNQVLVQVAASSINPIDLAMINGYGSVLLNFLRQSSAFTLEKVLEFPLTLGRDFSGVVVQKGLEVNNLLVGDEVWGVVPLHYQGCHAEQVLVPNCCVHKRPMNISKVEAGSMLYAAVTAWASLKITGGLSLTPARGKKVLVLGASGGVGTLAVQMLSSWGAHVIATCSADAVPLLESLGILDVIDYKADDYMEKVRKYKYDIILDCAGLGQEKAAPFLSSLKDYSFSKFVTLKPPLVKNFDEYGLVGGTVKNAADLVFANLSSGFAPRLSFVLWGFFIPLKTALAEITNDVSNGKVIPCIQKTYKFAEMPDAYQHVRSGHLRGKIAIDMTSER